MWASQESLKNCVNLSFQTGKTQENNDKKVALLYSNPLLTYATDITSAAAAMGNIDVGNMEELFNNKLLQEHEL